MTEQRARSFRSVPERTRHAAGTWWRGPGGHTALWCIVVALLGAYVWSVWPSYGLLFGAPRARLALSLPLLAGFCTAFGYAMVRLERRNEEHRR